MRSPYRHQTPWLASLPLLAVLWTAPCGAQQGAAAAAGTIIGRVTDSLAAPVAGAIVTLDTLGLATTADSTGAFRIVGVPPGRRTLTVHGLGFAPASVVVSVAPGASTQQTITMASTAVMLPGVKSQAVGQFGKPARLAYTMKYDGFYQRRFNAIGSGTFYTHEDLDAMKTADLVDMLRRIPFLKIRGNPDGATLNFPDCSTNGIEIEVDGLTVWPESQGSRAAVVTLSTTLGRNVGGGSTGDGGAPADPDPLSALESLHVNQVEAIEAYPTVTSLPAALVGNACAAILIWMR